MEFAELQFAATVRDLAVQLRQAEWGKHYYGLASELSQEEVDVLKSAWFKDHPATGYIAEAYKLIRDTALQIQTLE